MWYRINYPRMKKFEDFLLHDYLHHIMEPTLRLSRRCTVNHREERERWMRSTANRVCGLWTCAPESIVSHTMDASPIAAHLHHVASLDA
jgi:hypothetical protein